MAKPGPKNWRPTDEERRLVEHYVSIGYTQEQIGALMNKSVDSLDRYCRRELDYGALAVNAKIGGKLFQKAMAGDTASLIFWAKTRMGWKETQSHEHSGPQGGPIEYQNLSDEEVNARIAAHELSRGQPSPSE
jgi:hypothetical protein